MSFLHMFGNRKCQRGEPASSKLTLPEKPTCPAGLEAVEFQQIRGEVPYTVCVNYVKAMGEYPLPSPDVCPVCPYSAEVIRKDADERLEAGLNAELRRLEAQIS
jgi:hypothetical protein